MFADRSIYHLPLFVYFDLKIYFARVSFTFCQVLSVYVLYGSTLFTFLFYVSSI